MASHAHLDLRQVHLEPNEKWLTELNGLLFVFPRVGNGHYASRSVTHPLSPGDVLVLNPTGEGSVRADEGGEVVFSFFSAHPEDLFPLFGSGEISLLHNVCESFKATRLHGATTALARQCHRLLAEVGPELGPDHRSQLMRVAAALLVDEFKSVQLHLPGFVHAEDHLTQVLDELTADELMGLPIGELARRFACSKRHLSRLFHRHFGFSVATMKMEMRLLSAVAMLRDPDVKIINVAERCGFHNLGLFNTCFKRRFNVTPSQLRDLVAKADGRPFRLANHIPICPIRARGLCLHAGDLAKQPPPKAGRAETPLAHPAEFIRTETPAEHDQAHARGNGQRKVSVVTGPRAVSQRRV